MHFGFLQAQDATPITLNFNHSALSVKDLNQSIAFYKNVLHLQEITNRTKKEGIYWFSMGDGKELHLVSIIKEPVQINKAIHISFAIPESDFDSFIANLNNQKITYSSWTGEMSKITIRADGIKQIYFQDPDGYWIEINSAGQSSEESDAIKKLLEKESATWRAGDSTEHASCWQIQPYSTVLISTPDGKTMNIPASAMQAPITNPTGGSSINTDYKMSIHGDNAWVSHNEISTSKNGKITYSYEIRFLEKINQEWKIVGQSLHIYKTE
jgi:lactoylglutathione lyase